MKMIRNNLILVACLLALNSCTTPPVAKRTPSSQAQDAEKAEYIRAKNQFYLSLMPPAEQTRIDIFQLMKSAQADCAQSEYARYIDGTERADARDAFILKKLNRPFYYFNLQGQSGQSTLVGSMSDTKEIICAYAALAGGFKDNGMIKDVSFSTGFIYSALTLPHANFAILDTIINNWKPGAEDDVRIGQLILAHQSINIYSMEDALKKVFASPIKSEVRKSILLKIIRSKLFQANQQFFRKGISDSLQSASLSAEENSDILDYLAKETPGLIAPQALFEFVERKPDPTKDYHAFYLNISKTETNEIKAELLIGFLESQMQFSAAEDEFRKLLTDPPLQKMLSYALDFGNSTKRLSRQTIFRVVSVALARSSLSKNDLRQVLAISRDLNFLDLPSRLSLFHLTCQQTNIDLDVARDVLHTGGILKRESPQNEPEITNDVKSVIPRFLPGGSLLSDYSSFARHLVDRQTKLQIAVSLMTHHQMDDGFLFNIAMESLEPGKTDVAVMEVLLKQSSLSENSLDQISRLLSNRGGGLTDKEKLVVDIVKKHSLATDEIRKRLDRALKGEWQQLDPSDFK